jgi:phage terminase small subunit
MPGRAVTFVGNYQKMSGNKNKLTAKQQKAVIALMGCKTVEQAAKRAKVCERTLYRWLGESEFSQAYREARRQVFEQSVSQLQTLASRAVKALEGVLDDDNATNSSKIAAARTVLEHARTGIELDDVVSRLEKLEGILHGKKP